MDRWKAEMGRVRREKKKEDQKRESLRRKKTQVCEKVGKSRNTKNWQVRSTFGRSDVVSRGRRKGSCTLSKVSKTWGFCSISKNDGRRGTFAEECKDAFSVAGAIQETCSSEMLGGQGADFLRGVACWSIRSSVLGRWFCVPGAAFRMTWHHFFVASAVLL